MQINRFLGSSDDSQAFLQVKQKEKERDGIVLTKKGS